MSQNDTAKTQARTNSVKRAYDADFTQQQHLSTTSVPTQYPWDTVHRSAVMRNFSSSPFDQVAQSPKQAQLIEEKLQEMQNRYKRGLEVRRDSTPEEDDMQDLGEEEEYSDNGPEGVQNGNESEQVYEGEEEEVQQTFGGEDENQHQESAEVEGDMTEGDNAASAEQLEEASNNSPPQEKQGPRNAKMMKLLDQKLPSKFEFMQDTNDKALMEVMGLLDNFERVFVAYINDNYRTFTESDLQRLIKEELRVAMLSKFKEIAGGIGYTNCDPHKIKSIIKKNAQLKSVNEAMRESIHSVGITVNQLAKSSVALKKESFNNTGMDLHLRDIGLSIDKLNQLFNDIYHKVLLNDTSIKDVDIICKTTQSHASYLTQISTLEQKYAALEQQNLELKKQLFAQSTEYKNLQEDFEVAQRIAEENQTKSYQVKHMEQIVGELRIDNRQFMEKIEELQTKLFGKERELDKMRHQFKHGVAINVYSSTFEHKYEGAGGSIQPDGKLLSKLEHAEKTQHLLSQAQMNQLHWRDNSKTLIRLYNRFMASMRSLSSTVQARKGDLEVNKEKHAFESNKKELESVIKNIAQELENSELAMLRKGEGFIIEGDVVDQPSGTMGTINTFKNILSAQARQIGPPPERAGAAKKVKPLKIKQIKSVEVQTDVLAFQMPSQAASIKHYKPQELIRLEVENDALKEELETQKEYMCELQSKIDNLLKCIQETKTNEFLDKMASERQAERDAARNSSKQGDEEEVRSALGSPRSQTSKDASSKQTKPKVLTEQEKFESDMLDLKMAIKQTEELIAKSKMSRFTPEGMYQETTEKKGKFNETPEGPTLVQKMGELVKEKDLEVAELMIERQRQEDNILVLTRQLTGAEKRVEHLEQILIERDQAEVDQQELNEMRRECTYLKERVCNYEYDIRNLEDKLKETREQLTRNTAAQVESVNQEYTHLQAQLDQERNEYVALNNRLHATEKHLQVKTDQLMKVQVDLTEAQKVRRELESRVDELKMLIREDKASEHQITQLESRLRQFDAELVRSQNHVRTLTEKLDQEQLNRQRMQAQIDSNGELHMKMTRAQLDADQMKEQVRKDKVRYQDEILELQDQLNALQKQVRQKEEIIQEHKAVIEKLQETNLLLNKQKEDEFWARPSELDQELDEFSPAKSSKKRTEPLIMSPKSTSLQLNREQMLELEEFQQDLNGLQENFSQVRDSVISKLTEIFDEQLKLVNQKIDSYIKNEILDKQLEDAEQLLPKQEHTNYLELFENIQIKEVCRSYDTKGTTYLLIEVQQSLEDQIISKQPTKTYFIQESKLNLSAKQFLLNFIPESNDPEFLLSRVDQNANLMAELEIEMSELQEQKHLLQNEFDKFKEQVGVETSPAQTSQILKENLQIREQNFALQQQVMEHRKRTLELNQMVADLIAKGVRQQIKDESNLNEQQISYGKNIKELLGSPIRHEDNRVSGIGIVSDSDMNLFSQGNQDEGDLQASVLIHVKSNLKMYLLKNPIIDVHNEVILQIVYSLLNLSKDEIDEITNSRRKLPVYKIDEKGTKKAQAKTEPRAQK